MLLIKKANFGALRYQFFNETDLNPDLEHFHDDLGFIVKN